MLDGIGPNGEVSLETALGAFALAIGPLPGAQAPDGPRTGIPSGSGALRWVRSHWDELTPEQQTAVNGYLDTGANAASRHLEADADAGAFVVARMQPNPILGAQQQALEAEYQAAAEQLVGQMRPLVGRRLDARIALSFRAEAATGDGSAGFTDGANAAGTFGVGDMATCVIVINPIGQEVTGAVRVSLLAHELFHCYQLDLGPMEEAYHTSELAPWVIEGGAAWVGETVAGGTKKAAGWWSRWILSWDKPLFQRDYDAIGFYAHMAENGVDPWPRFDEMQRAAPRGNEEAYAIAAMDEELVDEWGPGYLRDATLQPRWDFKGPGLPDDMWLPPEPQRIEAGGVLDLTAPRFAARLVGLELAAEVVVIDPAGARGRILLPDKNDLRLAELSRPLCTLPGGCTCEQGTTRQGTNFLDTPGGRAVVGLTGHTAGARVNVTGWTLRDFCGPAATASPRTDDLCALLTAEEVSEIIGSSFALVGPFVEPGQFEGCEWSGGGSVTVNRMEPGVDPGPDDAVDRVGDVTFRVAGETYVVVVVTDASEATMEQAASALASLVTERLQTP